MPGAKVKVRVCPVSVSLSCPMDSMSFVSINSQTSARAGARVCAWAWTIVLSAWVIVGVLAWILCPCFCVKFL